MIQDLGAYNQLLTPAIPTLTGLMICGCYKVQDVEVRLKGVYTNKMSTDAYRGAGRPEATYTIERAVDVVARRLGLDPVEIRRRNFPRADEFPFKTGTGLEYDSGDYHASLSAALDAVSYESLREEQKAAREKGRLVGIGLSTYVEICAMGPSKGMAGSGWESARVTVCPDGGVEVYSGACPHGQGQETSFSQIAADTLGVPYERIRVDRGDTARLPFGTGTFGSRATAVGGTAVYEACRKIAAKMQRIAAHMLDAPEATVEREGDRFVAGGKSVPFNDVAFQGHRAAMIPDGMSPGLEETCFWEPKNFTFPFGTHVCLVSVDPETGRVAIEKYWAVDDCGKVINPLLVEGQVHGGIAQGLGQALFEEAIYDEDGQLVTGTLMDYTVPKITHFPWFHLDRTETPTDVNPLGAKGVGEAGTIGSTPALVNAVVDALRPLGVRHVDMPLKPEKIWRLIRGRRESREGRNA
jgi:carbon-monoxide dehydrogenase large subunit